MMFVTIVEAAHKHVLASAMIVENHMTTACATMPVAPTTFPCSATTTQKTCHATALTLTGMATMADMSLLKQSSIA
jgi:hypothetical protein